MEGGTGERQEYAGARRIQLDRSTASPAQKRQDLGKAPVEWCNETLDKLQRRLS